MHTSAQDSISPVIAIANAQKKRTVRKLLIIERQRRLLHKRLISPTHLYSV